MGTESILTGRAWRFEHRFPVGLSSSGELMTVEGRPMASLTEISGLVLCICTRRDTRRVRVPEQAYVSPIDDSYEVSEKPSTATDLQRICCGVSFSIKSIAP